MLILNDENGSLLSFAESNFVSNDVLELKNKNTVYKICCLDIKEALKTGKIRDIKNIQFPLLYDTSHGPLTNDTLKKYGVEVILISIIDVGPFTTDMIIARGNK